jgi:N-acetylglucosaminyl-diphospho-decaprenol L-rhamnosyltransferase
VDLSIVIVNYRTPELTLRAVDGARASCADLAVEEILVDNGAHDVAALRAGRPGAQVVGAPENRGFAAGVNAGIAACSGRHIAVVNSDAFCRGDALARLVAHLDTRPEVAVAAPALRFPDGRRQLNAYKRFPSSLTVFFEHCHPLSNPLHGRALHPYVVPVTDYDHARPVAHVMGAAFVVRREAAAAAGPLDEGYFMYLEETDWQRRMSAAGWEIDLVPEAEVVHLGGASAQDYAFAGSHYAASLDRYFAGRPGPRRAAIAGEAVTLVAARIAARVRPSDPRYAALADASSRALRTLRAWRPA